MVGIVVASVVSDVTDSQSTNECLSTSRHSLNRSTHHSNKLNDHFTARAVILSLPDSDEPWDGGILRGFSTAAEQPF